MEGAAVVTAVLKRDPNPSDEAVVGAGVGETWEGANADEVDAEVTGTEASFDSAGLFFSGVSCKGII